MEMSNYTNLKMMFETAQDAADVELFCYAGLPNIGKTGLVQVVADVLTDGLIKACENAQKTNRKFPEMAIMMPLINRQRKDFVNFVWGKSHWSSGWLCATYSGTVYGNFFSPSGFGAKAICLDLGLKVLSSFHEHWAHYDDFGLYKFGQSHDNTFIFATNKILQSRFDKAEIINDFLNFIRSN